jgi:hypothetical protein
MMIFILTGLAGGMGSPPGAAAAPEAPDEPVDGYGYTYIAGVNDPWIEANSGTLLTFSSPDDGYAGPLNIDFNFRFYEQTFSQLYVSTNGLVTFGAWSTAYQNKPIPWTPTPNNLIAGLWSDLKMHNGRAYLRTLGTAPARICVVEWEIYDLPPSNPAAVLILNFEVLLYENGDIVLQYKELDGVPSRYTVGIEDGDGINGLQYLPALAEGSDIRIIRPSPGPRVKALPRFQGGFVYDLKAQYRFSIENNGEWGADVYNLKVGSTAPGWQAKLYDRNGERLLSDTNSDAVIDTGSIGQGQAITVTLKVEAPTTALPGDYTTLVFTATSTLEASRWMTGSIQSAVPLQFSQLYVSGGIRMGQFWKENVIDRQVLPVYPGATLSMEATSTDNYLVAWELPGSSSDGLFTEIYYNLYNRLGGAGEDRLLTNSAEVLQEPNIEIADARVPTIAASPDGRVAVAWNLLKWRPLTTGAHVPLTREMLADEKLAVDYEKNSNVYFAILDAAGNRLSERYNVTQDAGWFLTGHTYEYPSVTVTGDGRYVVCWIDQFSAGRGVRCAAHTFDGQQISQTAVVQVATAGVDVLALNHLLTTPLSSNRVLVSFTEARTDATRVRYAVINSAGSLVYGPVELAGADGVQPRAVQFSNGKILLAWIEQDGRVAYTYLDTSFSAGPTQYFSHVSRRSADSLSVTLEREGQAVLTWVDLDDQDYLYYTVLNQDQAVRTPPMIFISDPWGDPAYLASAYGFGNAGYLGVYQISHPFISR